MNIEGVTREYCVTSQGRITLKNCIAKSCVKGTKDVFISGGSIAGAVSSSTGMVLMDNTSSDAVDGKTGVELFRVHATWVKSSLGKVKLTNCELSGDVDGKFSVMIVSSKCQNVQSLRVHANDATMGVVRAMDVVILINTSAHGVIVQSDKPTSKLNGDTDVIIRDSFIHTDVNGKNCVTLNDSTVLGTVQCTGPVKARGCNLGNVTAVNSITLDSTIAAVLTININVDSQHKAYLDTMNGSLFDRVIVKWSGPPLHSRVELHAVEPIACPIEFQGCEGVVICKI